MVRLATVRLRRGSDGREAIVNQWDYARDIARWKDWKLVGDSHDRASAITIQSGLSASPAVPDYLAMKWPELRKAVGALVRAGDAKARLPRNRAEAHAALAARGLIATKI